MAGPDAGVPWRDGSLAKQTLTTVLETDPALANMALRLT
jgi:hypothetical protein